MKSTIPEQRRGIVSFLSAARNRSLLNGSFLANSAYIMLANVLASFFGLIFWVFAARNYNTASVGVATALISAASMVLLVSRLGIDQSMVRWLPDGDRSSIISSTTIVTTILSVLVGTAFVLTAGVWSPSLGLEYDMALIFILLVMAQSMATTSYMAFIAVRRSKIALVQTIIYGSRIVLLFFLVGLGASGLLGAYMLSFIVAAIFGQYVLAKLGVVIREVDRKFLRASMNFSAGNWTAGLLANLPQLLLPIVVLNQLGAEDTAIYYMAFSFAAILFILPNAIAMQMFVEGCHGEQLRKITVRALSVSYLVLLPALAALYLLSPLLLGLLENDYAEKGAAVLRLLAASSLLQVPFLIFCSVKMVQKKVVSMVSVSLLNCLMLIGTSYLFMKLYGLEGIGWAWIVGYGITALAVGAATVNRMRGAAAAR